MNPTLVTATAESTGKTAVALGLARLAAERGRAVGYMKPKGTRLQSNVGKTLDEDPLLARDLLDLTADAGDLEPVVYSPTFVAEALRGREDPVAVRERVREAYDSLATGRDWMVLEGGGLVAGGVVDLTDADVADLLDARSVLVAGYADVRDVDPVLAAVDDLGDSLAGVLFNRVPEGAREELNAVVAPFLEGRDVPVLGALPRVPDLAGVSVAELARELGARVLTTEAPTDVLLERFTVGAMSGEVALRHFRRVSDAAVITGGDRPEIQTAALDAPGVRCLLLTGGREPPGTVLGRAEEAGVPVLLVQSDTITTVERAEDVVSSGRTRDAETVARMRSLLTDHADVDALLGD
ncbi:MAG: phosphotransacetylase family protein [Haloarculaceae archaeon]